MEKINKQTPDLTSKNIAKITELFPNVITEKEDENGRIVKAVDFDLLRQELSKDIADGGDERYRLDWPGKRRSILKANTPINKTLKPDRDSSVNFDTTENVYIEGDNFEVLKILQESYLGKIKMIYTDPPYNTGKDRLYKDNYNISTEQYEEEIKIRDEEGNKMFNENTRTNPRFHSDWLSIIYERLVIARDLLTDDGAIFMSIDDNEVHNLRKICDEIFGENNFVAKIVWQNKEGGGGSDSRLFKIKHEYCLVYSKNIESFGILGESITNEERYTESDEYVNERGKHLLIRLESGSLGYIASLDYPIVDPDGNIIYANDNGEKVKRWRWSKSKLDWGLKNGYVVFKKGGDGKMGIYTKQYLKADNEGNLIKRSKTPLAVIDNFSTTQSAKELATMFNAKIFDYPKPVNYIKWFVSRVQFDPEVVILDFFSGSSTTAHAVMQLNAEDGGNRKFIMVQIPEKTNEKSEAYKAGYKTIADIGRERIRRAGKRILEENAERLAQREKPLDIGFRSYKVTDSIMEDVYKSPNELKQSDLLELADNIKKDKTSEDILTSVILKLGLTLDLPIKEEKIGKNIIYNVADGSLLACFDKDIDFSIIDEIAKIKPLRVVFRDASFKDDKDRINVETKFKQLSPDTRIKVL